MPMQLTPEKTAASGKGLSTIGKLLEVLALAPLILGIIAAVVLFRHSVTGRAHVGAGLGMLTLAVALGLMMWAAARVMQAIGHHVAGSAMSRGGMSSMGQGSSMRGGSAPTQQQTGVTTEEERIRQRR